MAIPGSPEALRAAAVAWVVKTRARVFPLIAGTKKPLWEGWQGMASNDPAKVYSYWTETAFGDDRAMPYNIGYCTDEFLIPDIDVKNDPRAIEIYADELYGDFDTLEVETTSGGRHLIYRNENRDARTIAKLDKLPIDIKGVGGLAVAPGSVFDGKFYRILHDRPIKDAPDFLKARVGKPRERSVDAKVVLAELDNPSAVATATRIAQAAPGVPEGGRGSTCYKLALQMRDLGVTIDTAKEILRQYWAPRCDPPLPFEDFSDPQEGHKQGIDTEVEHAFRYAENPVGLRSAEHLLGDIKFEPPPAPPAGMPAIGPYGIPPANGVPLATLSPGLPAQSDLAMLPATISAAANVAVWGDLTESGTARSFARKFGHIYRFDHTVGKGFWFDGQAWRRDETNLALLVMREHLRGEAFSPDAKPADFNRLTKLQFAKSALGFVQVDGAIATTRERWDADHYLLGTPGGTLDLKTGAIRSADPEDYITRRTGEAPADRPDCPRWGAFLDEVTGGDKALANFLQRAAGYSLTGDTSEHALFFLFGPGGNGKSVFINVIQKIAGDYGRTAPMDTFTTSHGDKHPTDLAMLDGPRIVVATETEEGRAWAESRIKQMTGGDMITARFMRQDFFSYWPRFKLWIVGNHAPNLRNVDDAMRRRMNVIPFVYKPVNPDPHLEERLKAEWAGILRWAVNGCLMWQRDGLQRPEAVLKATESYFESQDIFGLWAAERAVMDPDARERPSTLLDDFNKWSKTGGELPISRRAFRGMIDRQRHLKTVTIGGRDFVKGIRLQGASFSGVDIPLVGSQGAPGQ